jgi:hypothetical protein
MNVGNGKQNSVLEIRRLHSFISGNSLMGTRIYIGFSPAAEGEGGYEGINTLFKPNL